MPDGKWVSKANLQTFWQMIRSKVLPNMVGDTVTSWLNEHVTPAGSAVVVDDTLTIQGAAADAKKTGDEISGLKEDFDDYRYANSPYVIDTTETLGWIDTDGNTHPTTKASREVYTDFIETTYRERIRFWCYNSRDTEYPLWGKIALYDENKNFIRRVDLFYETNTELTVTWTNPEENAKYFRYTYRTGAASAGQYVYTYMTRLISETILSTLGSDIAVLKNNVNRNTRWIDNNHKIYREQTIIEPQYYGSYINTNVVSGNTVDLSPITFIDFISAVVDCAEGDVFCISSTGGGAGRAWAFVDSDNKLICKAARNFVSNNVNIVAPAGSSKLILNAYESPGATWLKGSGSNYINNGSVLSQNGTNKYINTSVDIGTIVDVTPIPYKHYGYAIVECSPLERYIISGRGGSSSRLWAVLDSNYRLLAVANRNEDVISKVITIPELGHYLIINYDMHNDFRCVKGDGDRYTNDIARASLIKNVTIGDLPKNEVAFPTTVFSQYVQQQTGVSGAKSAIYKSGDWFAITYGENLDGTGTDIPKVTASGVLAMRYKKFKLVNGVESDVSYGTFAEKGTSYTDYQGNTAQSVGGWGLPSGIGNMQYMTTAYAGEYNYNGETNYGMTPCCCEVVLDSSGNLSFGTINELTLTINGVSGKFDLTRLSPQNTDYLLYLTTAAPYGSAGNYKWMQPVFNGIAYLTSTDGINWVYQWTLETPYQPQCEVMCVSISDGDLIFAARTQTRNSSQSDTLYIGKISPTCNLKSQYALPFSACRAFLIRSSTDILLFYTPNSKNVAECVRIIVENENNLYFWRWFTIWGKATWYLTCYNSVFPENFKYMYICGGNGEKGSVDGMTFIELEFDTNKPRRPNQIEYLLS